MKDNANGRFILFGYKENPSGGMYDAINTYNMREGAIKSWRVKEKDGWVHGHILDTKTGDVEIPQMR